MSLIDIVYNPPENWTDENVNAYNELFGAQGGRYHANAKDCFKVRAPNGTDENFVKYAAYINPNNPNSGPYGGTSFVIFPSDKNPCLIGLGVGTQGLTPDELILSKPGHARKVNAICNYVNLNNPLHERVAWAKSDPTRIDINIPDEVKQDYSEYANVFARYGNVMYAIFKPSNDKDITNFILYAFLDLLFEEKGYRPLSAFQKQCENIKSQYLESIFPSISESDVINLLCKRKYVVLEGPPGTGKTRMAQMILQKQFKNNGKSIQFHPNTTYENFIGGLQPISKADGLGFSFIPTPGFLMQAVEEAINNPKEDYLLHIDEINRADLAKVLGEAIYLFESQSDYQRRINLPYRFNGKITDTLYLPENLYILGTMNSSDRSIAILDIAIRRRFAFTKLWPSMKVIQDNSCELMQKMYKELMNIFIDNANQDALNLLPGHAYFLANNEIDAKQFLKTSLRPLLEEYISQGYVSGFSEHITAFIQKIISL